MRIALGVILAAYAGFTWWLVDSLHVTSREISGYQQQLAEPSPVPAAIVRFDGVKQGLVVPAWQHIAPDTIWAYASSSSQIDTDYTPELTDISVATGDWLQDKRLHPEANNALETLFDAAEAAGHDLIVTSAYRSSTTQRELHASSTANYGVDWAQSHIANPGESEHQLGLAADLSVRTEACKIDFSGCNLTQNTANWLAKNAHHYGFILRYPAGKEAITGIAHEPWHFRYVGKDMARIVYESGLTFDEVSRRLHILSVKSEPATF